MPRAEEFARTANQQILPRDLEPIAVLVDHLEPRFGHFRHRLLEQQYAHALIGAAPDAAAQLVQLRQAETLRMLDHHHGRVGDVDANFDNRRRDQHIHLSAHEGRHGCRLLVRLHAPVQQPHRQFGESGGQLGVQRHRGLQLQLLRFLDQGTDPVHLPALSANLAHALDDFATPTLAHQLIASVRGIGVALIIS